MHDIKYIRDFPENFDKNLERRFIEPLSQKILDLDVKKRSLINSIQKKQEERNLLASQIQKLKMDNQDASSLSEKAIKIKQSIQLEDDELQKISSELFEILSSTPNLLSEDVPLGKSDEDNIEIKKVGDKPNFNFKPKTHYELGENLKLMDFPTAIKLSGSRFVVLKGHLSRLERALAAFMIDSHTKDFGYTECSVPFLVNDATMFGTAQLPKFKEDLFKTTDGKWLISTSEICLTNFVQNSILSESDLPIKLTSFTPCFRSEAGAAGKDTVGIIRQHQFSKVELVTITKPENSKIEHEKILNAAENILKKLNIHYRVVLLSSGDTGFSSSKTYDIEVWMPGLNKYREISSCSNCLDFQARRMNAKYRDKDGNNVFLHTLNGSGLAVGRTIAAIMENYQTEDGRIIIPDVLIDYMGIKEITK